MSDGADDYARDSFQIRSGVRRARLIRRKSTERSADRATRYCVLAVPVRS
jgi:hypothetical protein